MRESWKCWGCVGLAAVLSVSTRTAAARLEDDGYEVLQIRKDGAVLRHPKREAACQQSGWSLCPASVGGGCCPGGDWQCGVSSCTVTTAGPTSACGSVGYYACPLSAGPGSCCPVGLVCAAGSDQCTPPAGASYSQSCPASYFACPASLGYGCCGDGKVCGSGVCYDSTPTTAFVSETVTTTDADGSTITAVTTSRTVFTADPSPSSASAAGEAATAAAVAKLIPSTVSKMPSIETGGSSSSGGSGGGGSGGLSHGALGGIVAGVVVLLAAVAVAAFFIIRRLRRTETAVKAAAESRRESSAGPSRAPTKPGFQPSVSEVASTDVDPRAQIPIAVMRMSDSVATPPRDNFLFGSGTSSPPIVWTGAGFDGQPPSSDVSDRRHSSIDNYQQQQQHDATRAYQVSPPLPPQGRVSYESSGYGHHGRQPSDASELGGRSISELGAADAAVDAGAEEQQQESTLVAPRGRRSGSLGPPVATRRASSGSGNGEQPPARPAARTRGSDNSNSAGMPGLMTVSEFHELHGYYGPGDHTGQTAARLNGPSTNSSVPSRRD
ncbi:hypothetical protein GGR56DRAFT_383589 [Xylariaceae sp. FL0804]|nr:hypothetical protein GGR56DRAFT_383589 [Xylariaceae sp. FL0804]